MNSYLPLNGILSIIDAEDVENSLPQTQFIVDSETNQQNLRNGINPSQSLCKALRRCTAVATIAVETEFLQIKFAIRFIKL